MIRAVLDVLQLHTPVSKEFMTNRAVVLSVQVRHEGRRGRRRWEVVFVYGVGVTRVMSKNH